MFVCSILLAGLILFGLFGYYAVPAVFWWAAGIGITHVLFDSLELSILLLVFGVVFVVAPIRRLLISQFLLKLIAPMMPKISETEKTALEAGGVWVEGEFFSGRPNLKRLMSEDYPQLSVEEQAFIDGPLEEICTKIDDWKTWQTRQIEPEVWDMARKIGLFGMIIPKEYGGLGFSHLAHSAVIQKLATSSVPLSIVVMVPNSLGPAELIQHYGSEDQKKNILPKLANGDIIPCFGLTEPEAGSDAGAMKASGVVFKNAQGELKIRLNWKKRYITLAAIADLIGLAFRLEDPENLLGQGTEPGITAALIPSDTSGVIKGRRHDPMGVPFYNCPIEGHDVEISVEQVIGGVTGCGNGWKMLMESLAAGRGISLPAQAAGGTKGILAITRSHALVRRQFGLPIGQFEGIKTPLANMAGHNYMLESARAYTLGALDRDIRPPVVTAIMKYYATETIRKICNEAMDILGGNGISMGPRNLVGPGYIAAPISITVEGANILTRTLIIFGQGLFRAHPYAFDELKSIEERNVVKFDQAFFGHIGHVIKGQFRAMTMSVTRGHLVRYGGPQRRLYQKLVWTSASFAAIVDLAMILLGGALKKSEMLSGRFADILSHQYLVTACLRRFEAEGKRPEDLKYLEYAAHRSFGEIQNSFDEILKNMPVLSPFFRLLYMWSGLNRMSIGVSDRLINSVALDIQENTALMNRHTAGMHHSQDERHAQIKYQRVIDGLPRFHEIEKKIRQAKGKVSKRGSLFANALSAGVINDSEFEFVSEFQALSLEAINVDDFTQQEYLERNGGF